MSNKTWKTGPVSVQVSKGRLLSIAPPPEPSFGFSQEESLEIALAILQHHIPLVFDRSVPFEIRIRQTTLEDCTINFTLATWKP